MPSLVCILMSAAIASDVLCHSGSLLQIENRKGRNGWADCTASTCSCNRERLQEKSGDLAAVVAHTAVLVREAAQNWRHNLLQVLR